MTAFDKPRAATKIQPMLRLLPLPLLAAPALALPVTVELDLIEDDAAFNRLRITVDPQVGVPFVDLSDTQTTVLTGTMIAAFDFDPATGQVASMTLDGGRVNASDVTFSESIRILFTTYSYEVSTSALSGTVFTPAPPAPLLDPTAGTFDAADHGFRLDQGSMSGQALGNPIALSVSPEEPFEGTGSGTGKITVSEEANSGDTTTYEFSIELPVSLDDSFDATDLTVGITASGTLKATGTIDLVIDPYAAWAAAEGIPGAPREGDTNADGVANAISWALGLGADENARPWLPVATPSGGFTLELPPGGTAVPLRIVSAPGLSGWQPVPLERLSSGANPLPAGSSGSVIISSAGISSEYLRLEIVE